MPSERASSQLSSKEKVPTCKSQGMRPVTVRLSSKQGRPVQVPITAVLVADKLAAQLAKSADSTARSAAT